MELAKKTLIDEFGVFHKIIDIVDEAEKESEKYFESLEDIKEANQYKVLSAFHKNRLRDTHFSWNTGYGYDDAGREITEKIYADIFHTEAALVRPIIVNGTHALTLTLAGIMRPGKELIYCTGAPYDTLHDAIGIRGKDKGSLIDFGIKYKQVELTSDGKIDFEALGKAITKDTQMVAIQRATGYAFRPAIMLEEIKKCADFVKGINPDIVMMADNCYGEFLDIIEPTDVGIDVIAGSLIKNPGGGLALTGGYIAGRKDLIDKVSYRMTSPGIGGECGPTFGQTRTMLQGLFIAPSVVCGAIKGAILLGEVGEKLGFEVCPAPGEDRSDIIQAIKLKNKENMISFCKGIQKAAPVDSHVTPEPWAMPGYNDDVIMAAGAFVQGSSIELSADGPIREPFAVYFQGGLTYEHSKFGIIMALNQMYEDGLLDIN